MGSGLHRPLVSNVERSSVATCFVWKHIRYARCKQHNHLRRLVHETRHEMAQFEKKRSITREALYTDDLF